jgi:threonine aldolase
MYFASDNWAGTHAAITENLARHSSGHVPAYGADDLDRSVEQKLCEIFERQVAVFFVATGTAANALALASISRPGGVTFCHREAHVIADECGAPQWFTDGARLFPVDGPEGKMSPDNLRHAIARYPSGAVHQGQAMAVTITQATETGSVHSLNEIHAISEIARQNSLPLHMDGARFANALVSFQCTPAEMTWKQGVDILSFGGTKNGCWCAEALIFMNPDDAKQLPFLRKRAGQLFSKSRFIAAQFDAYLNNDLWLDLARHANAMTQTLAAEINNSKKMRLAWQPQANEVFVIMKQARMHKLQASGAALYDWHPPHGTQSLIESDEVLVRLVTNFATTAQEVRQFAEHANS